MQYSPRLKRVMERIKKILEEEDVGAIVVIHEPGNTEYVVKLNPGYSCARYMPDGQLKIRAKLEDFGGDAKARNKKIADTSNMFKLLTETVVAVTYPIHEISERIDEIVKAEHTKSEHSRHDTQNN